ncbi:hypothetical protein DPMN_101292 [Dreissena polymorpha]|uniref:Uncharacterized protein n=1 Tax=Dreissena polymorpha TaxID=45954 RepID=A0A9D4LH97_DREPO|nr:hypothetical protein DPMN_101292 [Dreissena polymorpha]
MYTVKNEESEKVGRTLTADLLLISEDVRVFQGHLLAAIENTKQDSLQMENFEILYKGWYRRIVAVVQRQITAFTRARRLVNRYCNT